GGEEDRRLLRRPLRRAATRGLGDRAEARPRAARRMRQGGRGGADGRRGCRLCRQAGSRDARGARSGERRQSARGGQAGRRRRRWRRARRARRRPARRRRRAGPPAAAPPRHPGGRRRNRGPPGRAGDRPPHRRGRGPPLIYPTRRAVLIAAGIAPAALVIALFAPAWWTAGLALVVLLVTLCGVDALAGAATRQVSAACEGPGVAGVGEEIAMLALVRFAGRAPAPAFAEAALDVEGPAAAPAGWRAPVELDGGEGAACFALTSER